MLDRLQFLEEYLSWAIAVILALGGLLFIWWGMWEDRSRGRRRCPKCLYSMAGVPGLICPECGHDARREKRLYKTHRRPAAVAIGLVLLLLACAAPNAMRWYRGGWRSTVPTWVIVQIARANGWSVSVPYDKWVAELLRRYRTDDLGWGRRAALQDMVQHWAVDCRPKWPAGVPIHVRPAQESWQATVGGQASVRLSAGGGGVATQAGPDIVFEGLPVGTHTLRLDASLEHPAPSSGAAAIEWAGRVRRPIQIVRSVDEIITPRASPEVGDALLSELAIAVTVSVDGEGAHRCRFDVRPFHSEIWGMAIAVRIEILRDGAVIAATRVGDPGPRRGSELGPAVASDHSVFPSPGLFDNPRDHVWQVRIRGDGELAPRDFEATTYWSGEAITNLELIGHGSAPDGSASLTLATRIRRGR